MRMRSMDMDQRQYFATWAYEVDGNNIRTEN